jgi:ubiquinone/menaquinone biosynthesis C-methylase UbiE
MKSHTHHHGPLGDVYAAKSPQEIAQLYDGWSKTYDDDMARLGYRHPVVAVALLARYLPKGQGPILDAGCGTGLVGEWLGILGYQNVEAMDLSEGMLAVARQKKCYRMHHIGMLGHPLNFADQHFASVICSGVFTTGHVGTEGLGELLRICASGGYVVLTVKGTVWDGGFEKHVQLLVQQGLIRIAEITPRYVSMPGDEATTPSMGVVLQVT